MFSNIENTEFRNTIFILKNDFWKHNLKNGTGQALVLLRFGSFFLNYFCPIINGFHLIVL